MRTKKIQAIKKKVVNKNKNTNTNVVKVIVDTRQRRTKKTEKKKEESTKKEPIKFYIQGVNERPYQMEIYKNEIPLKDNVKKFEIPQVKKEQKEMEIQTEALVEETPSIPERLDVDDDFSQKEKLYREFIEGNMINGQYRNFTDAKKLWESQIESNFEEEVYRTTIKKLKKITNTPTKKGRNKKQ